LSVTDALEQVLGLSKADDCIAIAAEVSNANLRWANNTVTTNGVFSKPEIFLISIIGKRTGSVGRNYFPDDHLADLVRESEAACGSRPPAEDYMPLVEGDGKAPDWGEPAGETGIEVFDALASDLGRLFKQAESDGVKLFGYAEHEVITTHLATSSGVRKRYTQTRGKLEVNAKSDDYSRSSWAGENTKTFDDVSLDDIYRHLEQKLEWSRKSIPLDPGRYQVILEPSAVADMLIYAYWTSEARDADEGRTVFSKPGGGNRIGEKLYPEGINIYSDPAEFGLEVWPFVLTSGSFFFGPNSPSFEVSPSTAATSLFDNGLDTARTDWVKNGALSNLITPRYWAEKNGIQAVPYIPNLVFDSRGPTLDEMIASTERALLVTCFWYIRTVDPQTLLLTGLTRDGVFLVENGEVKGAVNNFRYNMSPVDMLAQAVETGGSDKTLPREWNDWFTHTLMPPLRVDNFNMSSVSQAT
jgi:predicted Zn-dependent protease